MMTTSNNDYSKMTQEELISAAEKLKSQKNMTAVLVGLFAGIAVFSAVQGKFLLTISLLIFSFVIGNSYSKKQKNIQAEKSRRGIAD